MATVCTAHSLHTSLRVVNMMRCRTIEFGACLEMRPMATMKYKNTTCAVRRLLAGACAALLLVGAQAASLSAQDQGTYREQDAALQAMQRGEILPYAKIRKRAEQTFKGQLVGERLRRSNKGWVYEVRVRQGDGRVVFGLLDAATGKEVKKP